VTPAQCAGKYIMYRTPAVWPHAILDTLRKASESSSSIVCYRLRGGNLFGRESNSGPAEK